MTSLSRTARGGPAVSLKRGAQAVEVAREGVGKLAGSFALLLEVEHRGEWYLPVVGAGQLLGAQLASVDESHDVLAGEP